MIAIVILLFVCIPFLAGYPVRKILDPQEKSLGAAYLCGVLTLFLVSGALQLLLMLLHRPFTLYERIYPLLLLALSVAGLCLAAADGRRVRQERGWWERFRGFVRSWFRSRESQVFSILTLLVLLLCGLRIWYGTPDVRGDFTMETLRTTLETDTIYEYNSLTGLKLSEGMPIRQQILTVPFFLAFLTDFFHLPATLLVYRIFPCIVLLWTALVYARWGSLLFSKQREKESAFLFLVCVLLLAGDYAALAPASLLLHQGFTGNAVCAGVVLPFVMYLCMKKKWLAAVYGAAAEVFLVWTTYGLGFSAWCILIFGILGISGYLLKKKRKTERG